LNTSKQTSRNDSRKRKSKKTVSEDEESGDGEESEEGENGEEEESSEEGEGEEVEATVLPAGGEGGGSLGNTSAVERPIQPLTGSAPKKVKKPIAKTWETVENLRRLSDNSRSIIRTLAASSQSTHAQSLVLLCDRLSVSTQDNSQIMSLDDILKRCIITDVNVVESKFLHMVALMQLALWLSE